MSEETEAGRSPAGRDPLLMAGLAGAVRGPQYDELVPAKSDRPSCNRQRVF
jgi:hypothetical protein